MTSTGSFHRRIPTLPFGVLVPVLVLLVLATGGCVQPRQYTVAPSLLAEVSPPPVDARPSIRPCDGPTEQSDGMPAPDCSLAIIEFDDQGEFWDDTQLADTLDLIHRASRPDQPALVLLFVHGWSNDASPRNEAKGNLGSFGEVLVDLAAEQRELCAAGRTYFCERPIIGIYMAWRGRASRTVFGRPFTYFTRRATAEQVGRVSFSHAVHRIVNHAKGSLAFTEDGAHSRGNPESIVVAIGHSFGALILENTIFRSLTHETDDFRESFPIDLAVLVNSANDAIITRQFVRAVKHGPPAAAPLAAGSLSDQRLSLPLIVSITSQGDWATRYLTPVTQSVRRIGKSLRHYQGGPPNQAFYFRRTAGHSGPRSGLISHQMTCHGPGDGCEAVPATRKSSLQEIDKALQLDRDLFEPPIIETGPCTRAKDLENQLTCIDSIHFRGSSPNIRYEIRRVSDSPNDTFFWVLQLPRRIVPNHSRIFQSEFVSLTAALVSLRWAIRAEDLGFAPIRFVGLRSTPLEPTDAEARRAEPSGDEP